MKTTTSTQAASPSNSHLFLAATLITVLTPLTQGQVRMEAWGDDSAGGVATVPLGTGYLQAEAGDRFGIALRSDGSIARWGRDVHINDANTPTETGFTKIAAGLDNCIALTSNGTIVGWGSNSFGTLADIPSGSGYTELTLARTHGHAIRPDGSIASWGQDSPVAHITDTPSGNDFVELTAGYYHTVARRTDGSLVAWGASNSSIVQDTPSGTGFLQVDAGYFHSLAIHADGSVIAWGDDILGNVTGVPAGNNFVEVSGGHSHSVALRTDGTIVAWGINDGSYFDYGQVPNAPAGAGFVRLGGGHNMSTAFRADTGSAFCFGDGTGVACPCSNSGPLGTGCGNSGEAGAARLSGFGASQLATDSFGMHIAGVPGSKPGLLMSGTMALNGGNGVLSGDGLLCVAGQSRRSHVQNTTTGLTTFVDFDGSPFGTMSYGAGVSTNYQFWYRDPLNTCSGSGFNFTNAWTVAWTP